MNNPSFSNDSQNNITLIGMSGVGKSTFGRELASRLGWNFIDVDTLIKNDYNLSLPKILKKIGSDEFKKLEQDKILSLSHISNTIIAPGGSVIYSDVAMELLSQISTVVYLDINPETLQYRVGNKDRGIIGLDKKTFADLYRERIPLYKKWSDEIIDINHKNMNMILEEISNLIR
jgi:shikimate kinase